METLAKWSGWIILVIVTIIYIIILDLFAKVIIFFILVIGRSDNW